MLKRNILQVAVLVVALSAFGQASDLGSSSEEAGPKSVLANNNHRALGGKGKGKGKGGSKGKGKGKGKVSQHIRRTLIDLLEY
jgi:hypothetical protein